MRSNGNRDHRTRSSSRDHRTRSSTSADSRSTSRHSSHRSDHSNRSPQPSSQRRSSRASHTRTPPLDLPSQDHRHSGKRSARSSSHKSSPRDASRTPSNASDQCINTLRGTHDRGPAYRCAPRFPQTHYRLPQALQLFEWGVHEPHDNARPHSSIAYPYSAINRSEHVTGAEWPGKTAQQTIHQGFSRREMKRAVPPAARDDDDESSQSPWEIKPWHQSYTPRKPLKFEGQSSHNDYQAYDPDIYASNRYAPMRHLRPEQTSLQWVDPDRYHALPFHPEHALKTAPSYVERIKAVEQSRPRQTLSRNSLEAELSRTFQREAMLRDLTRKSNEPDLTKKSHENRYNRQLMKTPVPDLLAGTASWVPKDPEDKRWCYDTQMTEEAGWTTKKILRGQL